jgi:hypothetical protein
MGLFLWVRNYCEDLVMSTKNSTVSLTLTLKGNAGQELRKIGVDQLNLTKKVNEQLNLGTTATGKMVQIGARVTSTLKEQVNQSSLLTKQLDSSQRNGQLLEKFMQQSAVQARNLQKAVQGLGLDKTARQTNQIADNMKRAQMIAKTIAIGTGVGVGGAVIGRSIGGVERKAMGTDMAIRQANNTLQYGDSAALKKQGRDVLNVGLHEATVDGLASRQDVANLINQMSGQGIYDDSKNKINGAKRIATGSRDIVKTSIAADADLGSVADLYKGIYQVAGVTDPQRARAMLDAGLRAGQIGSNELKDMAPGAASIMTSMANAGYSGETLVKEFFAQSQVAKLTDSDSGKANTNMQQAYKDLNSQFLQNTFAKNIPLTKGLPSKLNGHGKAKFDWQGFAYERKRDRGQSMVESAAELVDMQMQTDPRYREVKKKMSKLDPSDKKNNTAINTALEEMSKMVQGSVVGSDFHNLETNKFMLAMLLGKNQHKKYMEQLNHSEGAVDEAVGGLKDETGVKQQAAQNAADLAGKAVADSMKGSVDRFYDAVTAFVNSHPIAAATVGAGYGVTKGVAAGIGGGAFSLWLAQKMGWVGDAVKKEAPELAKKGATTGARAGAAKLGGRLLKGGELGFAMLADDGADWTARALGGGKSADMIDRKDRHKWDWLTGKRDNPFMAENDPRQQDTGILSSILAELEKLNNKPPPTLTLNGTVVSEHVTSHTTTQGKRGAAVNAGGTW